MHPRNAAAFGRSKDLARSIATIDGRRLAYVRLGEGEPAVVLLSGAGMGIDSWFKVLAGVATMTTVIAYDRLGVGRSERPAVAQTGAIIIATLRELLSQAGVVPPYIVVAHSLGGLHAELFARLHSAEVAGMVLVEAASPEEAAAPPTPGLVARAIGGASAAIDRLRGRPRGLDEVDVVEDTVRQLRAALAFPGIPLVVVSGGRRMRMVPETAFREHLAAQGSRVALSPLGRQVIAGASGHFPQLHEPTIVIDAVREVLAACHGTDTAGT